MSRPMTFQELVDVMKHIAANNSPFCSPRGIPCVKYAHPSLDFRTNTCFAITLRGFAGGEKVFHTQNECRDLPLSLHDRVMKYLNGEEVQ